MTDSALIERITRSLAYMLRHQPEKFDLEIDPFGFAPLDEVVRALNERLGERVVAEDVITAVESGDRIRYEVGDGVIRALYGHSIAVEPGEPSKPPDTLFVAIPTRDADRARRFGLRGGRRRFLHLALNLDDSRESGRRAAREYTVLSIRALDAWEEGVNFYDRRSLWLAEEVPTHLLEDEGEFDDGTEPMHRRGAGSEGGDGRHRGRDRGPRRERGDRERAGRGGRPPEGRARGRGGEPPRERAAAGGGGREDERPRGRDDERPRGRDDERPRGRDEERPRGREDERPRGREDEHPRGREDERPRGRGGRGDERGGRGRGRGRGRDGGRDGGRRRERPAAEAPTDIPRPAGRDRSTERPTRAPAAPARPFGDGLGIAQEPAAEKPPPTPPPEREKPEEEPVQAYEPKPEKPTGGGTFGAGL